MDDPMLVSVFQSVGDLLGDADSLIDGNRTSLDATSSRRWGLGSP